MTKMGKTDTQFMIKMAENPTLWDCTYTYKGIPPPPGVID